ncbi:MAG: helix-turn-helix transcriptional regulator [Candidatus Yonathbacteria bacterium]|nr:helix-turn-helix transcriptional regulator [Candidatus Yonathbacteria bacterium]
MYTFPELIKEIRNEANITQIELAKILGVSPVLITMVETGQKEVSKKFLLKIANVLKVHPLSITPFLFTLDQEKFPEELSEVEKKLILLGEKIQHDIIRKKSKHLKNYL